jgi:hypothetical protein
MGPVDDGPGGAGGGSGYRAGMDVNAALGRIAHLQEQEVALAAQQQLALRLLTTQETVAWEALCAAALPSLASEVVAGLCARVALPIDRFATAQERDRKALHESRLDLYDQMLDEVEFARLEQHRHLVEQRLVDLRARMKALRSQPGLVERIDDVRRGKPVKPDVLERVQEHDALQRELAKLESESTRVAAICARHRRARLQIADVDDQIRRIDGAALTEARRALAEDLLGRGRAFEDVFVDDPGLQPLAHRVRSLQARRTLLDRIAERLDAAAAELEAIRTRLTAAETFVRSAGAALLLELEPRHEALLSTLQHGLEAATHAAVDELVSPGSADDVWWVVLFPDVDVLDEEPSTVAMRRGAEPLATDETLLPADLLPAPAKPDHASETAFLPSLSGVFTTKGPIVAPEARAIDRGAFARGTRLGRYVVEGLIGKGGMAEVYLAQQLGHADFKKRVVLKRMATDLRGIEDVDRMFAREAQTAARLNHPNVVQIFDYQAIDGEAFIVMEHLEGVSLLKLANLLRQGGRDLAVPQVLRAIADAARGLHTAHTHGDDRGQPSGLIHRDISPDNLFLTTTGFTKVLDFGIAKRDDLTTLTGKNELKGKIPYMAPEQIQSESLDARADIFSLGATAYWLLCGQRPFVGTNEVAVLHAVLTRPPPPLRAVRPDLDDEVERFVLSMLEKDRNDRPPTAAAVARRCEQLGAASHEDLADLLSQLR